MVQQTKNIMIKIIENTPTHAILKKENKSESWGNISNEHLLKILQRENDIIEKVKFYDVDYLTDELHIILKKQVDMDQLEKDLEFVRSILPKSYTVKLSNHSGSINCESKVGILHKKDADDDEHWEYITKAIKNHFGNRFLEIDHITSFGHRNFTIYLK